MTCVVTKDPETQKIATAMTLNEKNEDKTMIVIKLPRVLS